MEAPTVAEILSELEAGAQVALDTDQVPPEARILHRSADLRYRSQTYTVDVAVPSGPISEGTIKTMVDNFHRKHEALYTFKTADAAVELVNLRLRGVGVIGRPELTFDVTGGASPDKALAGRREVYFDGAEDFVDCGIFDRSRLLPGNRIPGPAIVEQLDSTIVIPPSMVGTVDRFGNVVIGREVWNERAPD